MNKEETIKIIENILKSKLIKQNNSDYTYCVENTSVIVAFQNEEFLIGCMLEKDIQIINQLYDAVNDILIINKFHNISGQYTFQCQLISHLNINI